MPGIITSYTEFADAHVAWLEKKGKKKRISRAKVEYQILQEIEKADLLIDCKLSWTHAILASQLFDALWDSISRRLKLPKSCTARYIPDPIYIQFEAPSDDELEDGVADSVEDATNDAVNCTEKAPPNNNQNTRQSSPDIPSSASGSTTPEELLQRAANMPTPAEVAARMAALPQCDFCSSRGHDSSSCPHKPTEEAASGSPEPATNPTLTVRDEHSRATLNESEHSPQEARDSSYEEPSRQKARRVKPKTSAKAVSKPQGVKKTKPAPKKKSKTPAQLKTAAIKSREPVDLNAAEPASAVPDPTATTPARPSKPNNKNLKRQRDEDPVNEEDSPASKKAKSGDDGAAAAGDGARKMGGKSGMSSKS